MMRFVFTRSISTRIYRNKEERDQMQPEGGTSVYTGRACEGRHDCRGKKGG